MKNGLYKSRLMGATIDLTSKRIYFYGGIFSQWAECSFIDKDNEIFPNFTPAFNSAEQAMMAAKALCFDDMETFEHIMDTKSPAIQKALGRGVKGYVDSVWDEKRFEIVSKINYWKFSQNEAWLEILILTNGFTFVECSPDDLIWGVGLGEDNPLVLDSKNWKGANLLGKAINDAQSKIIHDLYVNKN